ncbi:MAG: aspartyl protease family protein [Bacteroidetes bacterium]|nr:aspartyl protease family protein [Bacteroidota bacterium]
MREMNPIKMGRYITFLLIFFCFLSKTYAQKPDGVQARIPFELYGNLIFLKVMVNQGGPYDFIFDTGSTSAFIDAALADSLDLPIVGSLASYSPTGTNTVDLTNSETIGIGDLELQLVNLAKGFPHYHEFTVGRNIDGVLNLGLFSEYVLEIDFDHSQILLYSPNGYRVPLQSVEIDYRLSYGIPEITCFLKITENLQIRAGLLLDTGDPSSLLFTSPYIKRHRLIGELENFYSIKSSGSDPELRTELLFAKIDHVNIANHVFEDVPVKLHLGRAGVMAFTSFDGTIGNELLKRFNLVFDDRNGKLHMRPNSHYLSAFPVNCSGLTIKFNENKSKIVIDNIVKNSPAQNAGLRINDEILAVNFKPSFDYELMEINQLLSIPGQRIALTVNSEGTIKEITLHLRSLL